jgi:tripartite-type tricarboxylate transporter receptor subunit TctC
MDFGFAPLARPGNDGGKGTMTLRWLSLVSMALTLAIEPAQAQSDYPNKPVRIVVDSAAGSANDAALRILGDKLCKIWNQQVLTLNQPGAGGGISARVASEAPPDGYTLYMPATSPFLSLHGAPGVAPNLPIELPRDFVPISIVLEQPLYIGASHKAGINTIADVIRRAKEKPGQVSYAATGRGRLTHLTMLLLEDRAGIRLQLIPYAGGPAQAMNDVMSGLVPLVLDGYAGLAPAIKGNLIRGLASTALKRPPGFEDLPTIAETIPNFFVGAWNVMLAPLGTPEAIVRKVNADMKIALADPDVQTKLAANGGFVRHSTPEEVTTFVQNEQKTWRPILERLNAETPK